jgi:hypothetical protein
VQRTKTRDGGQQLMKSEKLEKKTSGVWARNKETPRATQVLLVMRDTRFVHLISRLLMVPSETCFCLFLCESPMFLPNKSPQAHYIVQI